MLAGMQGGDGLLVSAAAPLLTFLLVFVWMAFVMTSYTVQPDGTIVATPQAGFSWGYKSDLVFNWHPVLMSFGFLFCSSQGMFLLHAQRVDSIVPLAILVFVTKPFAHITNKLIHVACHSVSILSVTIGTIAIFRYHNEHGFHNLRSVHSWVGLTTLIAFGAQYMFGYVVYYFPGAAVPFRKQSMPFHIGVGLGVMGLIAMTFGACSQICDLTGTLHGANVSSYMASDCVLGSVTAVSIALLFVALLLVVWVSKHPVEETIANPDVKIPFLK
ncbi:hypothetical protein DYB35_005028 [Aphanomyces astaci]|uniref:Cytochrome b561 domain-containing protein n=1 Tax=Aphanomyces astaci TaxID=112090 RepID=A0A3R7BJ35_APHAT|nr:hypothetical protein DYB35_005028 [Aphanomyces astaci]